MQTPVNFASMSEAELAALDTQLATTDRERWQSFYTDRAKPCPFFVSHPDESLVEWVKHEKVVPGRAIDHPDRDRQFREARAFYAVIAATTLAGTAINFTALDPIKALYWSAVINGLLAAPLMAVMMFIATNKRIMGRFTLPWPMIAGGWLATAVMAAVTVGFFVL